jgi:hypothetical protein
MFRRAVAWRFVCGCYLVCRPDLTRPKFTDGLAPVKWSIDGPMGYARQWNRFAPPLT